MSVSVSSKGVSASEWCEAILGGPTKLALILPSTSVTILTSYTIITFEFSPGLLQNTTSLS